MARKPPPVKPLIIRYARKYGLDPAAVMAVARGEGGLRWGAVGDQGTSYGPFQLHVGGALPKGRDAKWANSPAGLEYAIRKMSESGARGLKGEAAINNIVRRFERPADPDTSVRNAIGRLGSSAIKPTNLGIPAPQPKVGAGSLGSALPPQAVGTLNDIFRKVGLKPLDIVGDLPLPSPTNVPGRLPAPQATGGPALPKPLPKGTKMPRVNLMLNFIAKAQELGLSVRENPWVDPVAKVHVSGSDHYRVIGKRKGKTIGGGLDVSGSPQAMRAYFDYVSRYAGKGLKDAFYDPAGFSFDNGRRWDKTIGGHGDHVHVSV